MIVYTDWTQLHLEAPTALCLGFFDGLHVGHRELIAHTAAAARERGYSSAVFTFSDASKSDRKGTSLMTWENKVKTLESLGVDLLFAPAFDEGLRRMEPECFVQELLAGRCCARYVACGFNYSFGYRAAGTPETLQQLGTRLGMEVYVQDAINVKGSLVSSTRIRIALAEGNTEEATLCLGHPYSVEGITVPGRHIGQTLGFPTCNLVPDPGRVLPRDGVYATRCILEGRSYPAVTNVGTNPTVQGTERRVETHILNLSAESLYGKAIAVEFLHFLRPEIAFDSREALRRQIASDKEGAAAYFQEEE